MDIIYDFVILGIFVEDTYGTNIQFLSANKVSAYHENQTFWQMKREWTNVAMLHIGCVDAIDMRKYITVHVNALPTCRK
jgi:hypothetical protein